MLSLCDDNKRFVIPPRQGRLVSFLAGSQLHAAYPVRSGVRFAVVVFFGDPFLQPPTTVLERVVTAQRIDPARAFPRTPFKWAPLWQERLRQIFTRFDVTKRDFWTEVEVVHWSCVVNRTPLDDKALAFMRRFCCEPNKWAYDDISGFYLWVAFRDIGGFLSDMANLGVLLL